MFHGKPKIGTNPKKDAKMQTEPRTGKVRSAGAGAGPKHRKFQNLPATAPATPHGLEKGGKVPEVKKDSKRGPEKSATPLGKHGRKGFMKTLFGGDAGKGTRVKKGFEDGGAVKDPEMGANVTRPRAPSSPAPTQQIAQAKLAQASNVPAPATAAPKPVPSPTAPNPAPKPLQVQAQEKAKGKGIMGKLFPKFPKRGFEEGGYVDGGTPEEETAAEPGEVMSTAPESSGEVIEGTEPVANAAAEAFPQQDKGELPAEVPGDGSDQVKTEGPFSDYLKEGVDPQLVEKGNELTKRLETLGGDQAGTTQFAADVKDYIDELGNAVKVAQGQGGGEMLRGLKAMLKDAQDLMAAHETTMAESGGVDQAIQNAPDIMLQASRKEG